MHIATLVSTPPSKLKVEWGSEFDATPVVFDANVVTGLVTGPPWTRLRQHQTPSLGRRLWFRANSSKTLPPTSSRNRSPRESASFAVVINKMEIQIRARIRPHPLRTQESCRASPCSLQVLHQDLISPASNLCHFRCRNPRQNSLVKLRPAR